jgi:putative ABC transport system permease protein
MKFTQAIKMALTSIMSNKMRSFLTMLGIIIGISSVIVLIAIGNGSKQAVTEAIQGMGTNLLTVNITGSKSATITDDDVALLKSTNTIVGVSPYISGSVTVKAGSVNSTCTVEASTPTYESVRDVHTVYGRFITQDDIDNRFNVIDVGVDVLKNVYPDMLPSDYKNLLDTNLTLNGTHFQIIGILERSGSTTAGSNDNRVIMPLSSGERFLKNKTVKTYYVQAASADDVNAATNLLNTMMLSKLSDDSTQYRVFSQSQLLATRTATADKMTMMLAGIAAISLLVGGIGIMNIMLVSVIERTREIGIRKAIGAKRRDIMLQFLIEAVVISCVGGIVGVLISVIASIILPSFLNQAVILAPEVMAMAFMFSAAVGIIFGLYPAGKASKLRPIEALRYE